jgi:hypothetical protein
VVVVAGEGWVGAAVIPGGGEVGGTSPDGIGVASVVGLTGCEAVGDEVGEPTMAPGSPSGAAEQALDATSAAASAHAPVRYSEPLPVYMQS